MESVHLWPFNCPKTSIPRKGEEEGEERRADLNSDQTGENMFS